MTETETAAPAAVSTPPRPSATPGAGAPRMAPVRGMAAAAAPATVPFEAGAVPPGAGTEPSAGLLLAAGRSCSSRAYAPPNPAPPPTRPASSAAVTTPAMPRLRRGRSTGGVVAERAISRFGSGNDRAWLARTSDVRSNHHAASWLST